MRFRFLDIVRGLAALWVFTYHFPLEESLREAYPFANRIFRQGDLGVPLFFVVSGYCMMASARSAVRRDEPVRSYLWRRLMRIFPPYWCSILVVLALPWVMEGISSFHSGRYEVPAPRYLELGFLDWLQYFSLTQIFAPGFDIIQKKFNGVNSVYWTLAIEVQFYLVIGAGLYFRRFRRSILVLTTIAGVACAFVPSLYVHGIFLPYWPMFALGILVYLAFERGMDPVKFVGRGARFLPLVSLAIVGAALFCMGTGAVTFEGHGFAAITTLALWFARPIDDWLARPERGLDGWFRKGLILAGAMSYTVYLLHDKVNYLAMMFVRRVFAREEVWFMPATILLTLVFLYPFYRWCEVPFILGAPKAKPVQDPETLAPVPVEVREVGK